jgi:predicted metal-dependent enzyme (double-stranded beta helix superfamily)
MLQGAGRLILGTAAQNGLEATAAGAGAGAAVKQTAKPGKQRGTTATTSAGVKQSAGATTDTAGTREHDAKRTAKLIDGPGGQRKLGTLSRPEGTALSLYRPEVARFGVRELVNGIEHAFDAHAGDQQEMLDAVSKQLAKMLADPKAIDDSLIRTSAERYTRTLLHRDPQQRFIVLLLAWAPGQKSPIHDHECWGAVGVYKGVLAETQYEKNAQGMLEGGATQLAKRGTLTTVNPPDTDLHTMSNPSKGVTVTVHVYGRDMTEANVYDAQTGQATRKQIAVDYEEMARFRAA